MYPKQVWQGFCHALSKAELSSNSRLGSHTSKRIFGKQDFFLKGKKDCDFISVNNDSMFIKDYTAEHDNTVDRHGPRSWDYGR